MPQNFSVRQPDGTKTVTPLTTDAELQTLQTAVSNVIAPKLCQIIKTTNQNTTTVFADVIGFDNTHIHNEVDTGYTVSYTNGTITVDDSGRYLVTVDGMFDGNANRAEIDLRLMLDGVAVPNALGTEYIRNSAQDRSNIVVPNFLVKNVPASGVFKIQTRHEGTAGIITSLRITIEKK